VVAGAVLLALFAAPAAWATTYTVSNGNDSGPGSLRAAIESSNGDVGAADTITVGASPITVTLQSLLQITEPVVLEGLERLTIDDVSTLPEENVLVLEPGSDHSTVSGLTISGASSAGIAVVSSENTITANVITGNAFGVDIYSSNNTIGGTIVGTGNSIWGNTANGVTIQGPVAGNVIQGNMLGAEPGDASTSGNGGAGVAIFGAATQNTIGSSSGPNGANIIDGNGGIGVYISGARASSNTIDGNFIGTGAEGLSGVEDPNSGGGVQFAEGASNNTVSGGVVFAAGDPFAIDAGGGANQVEQVSLGGGPGPLIIGGQSATVGAGAATAGAGGSSIPVTVTNGPAGAPVEVDLLEGSCAGDVAQLSYLATTSVTTDAFGTGTGTLTTFSDPLLPVFSTDDSSGVSDLADPCPEPKPSGIAINATEGQAFSGAVARITDCPSSTSYTATIEWGDGSPVSDATVTSVAGNTCMFNGTHTYKDVGSYTLTVHATAISGAQSTGTSTVTVADAPLTVTGSAISGIAGTAFDGVVATLTDAGGLEPAAYTVSIDWGDGSTSSGTVDASGHIDATHIYDKPGTFSFTVTVDDPGGASATGSAKASIAATVSTSVTGNLPVNTAPPRIVGPTSVEQTLTASTGVWTGNPTSYTYQWQDCNSGGEECRNIAGATKSTYVLTSSDNDARIRVTVTATNGYGSTSATSIATEGVEGSEIQISVPRADGTTATLSVSCGDKFTCSLEITLLVLLSGGHIASAGDYSAVHHAKVIDVGRAKASIPAGHTKNVRVRLNQTGRRLLAKYHKLKVKVEIRQGGHTVRTLTITFKATKPGKRKHH
jgi:hypothetical protein